jgi:hypothetical protein
LPEVQVRRQQQARKKSNQVKKQNPDTCFNSMTTKRIEPEIINQPSFMSGPEI